MIRAAQINWYGVQKQIENVYKNKVKHFIQKFLRFWTLKIAQKLTKTNTSPAQPKFSTHTNSCTFFQKKISIWFNFKRATGLQEIKKRKKNYEFHLNTSDFTTKFHFQFYKAGLPFLLSIDLSMPKEYC